MSKHKRTRKTAFDSYPEPLKAEVDAWEPLAVRAPDPVAQPGTGPRLSYYDKLRDPRWQKMRLKVMERENFTCQDCGDKTTTLNVHHTYYERGKAPWEYFEGSLKCLCEPCHERAEQERMEFMRMLGSFDRSAFWLVQGFLQALSLDSNPHASTFGIRADLSADDNESRHYGMLMYFGLEFSLVRDAMLILKSDLEPGGGINRQALRSALEEARLIHQADASISSETRIVFVEDASA